MEKNSLNYGVSFNLADAIAYIPSGRLNNLKHTLNWDDHVPSEAQIKAAIMPVLNKKFEVDMSNLDKYEVTYVNNFMKSTSKVSDRKSVYRETARAQVRRPELFGEQIHDLAQDLRSELSSLVENVMLIPEIQKRINKLNHLRELNAETVAPKKSM